MTARELVPVLVPSIAVGVARIVGRTLRVRTAGLDGLAPLAGEPLIFAGWHGRAVMMPWFNGRLRVARGTRPIMVLASRSRDGEMLARFVGAFGLGVVRGSSSRGGASALRALVASVRAGCDIAVAPDGPRGPARQVQPGVVMLAAATGAPIVPMAFGARPGRRLGSWDGCIVPAPFARCAYVFGPAMRVERRADLEAARRTLAREIDRATADADELAAA